LLLFIVPALYLLGISPSFSENANLRYQYEKRESVNIPRNFPILLLPVFHRGDDQSEALICELNRSLQNENVPVVLWTESKGIGSHEMRDALESMLKNHHENIPLEALIQKSRTQNPVLQKYVKLNSVFEMLNREGSDETVKQQKKELVRKIFGQKFFADAACWAVDEGALLEHERKSIESWKAILNIFRMNDLAAFHLSNGDVKSAYRAKELEFKNTVEMVYLRNRDIWKQFQEIHAQHPDRKIIAVIGGGHVSGFHASPSQILSAAPEKSMDISGETEAIQREIDGTLSGDEREKFIWNNYLKQKLVGQAPDSGNFEQLAGIMKNLYVRIDKKGINARTIFEKLAKRVSKARITNPAFQRGILLDILLENQIISLEERQQF